MKTIPEHEMLAAIGMAAALACTTCAFAEEGGSGHYMPGGNASVIDTLPDKPGFAVANYFMYYDASASPSRILPYGVLFASDVKATAYADTVLGFYTTPWQFLGGTYAVALAVPYVWTEVKGNVQFTGPGGGSFTGQMQDSTDGVGDILFYPLLLGWTNAHDLKYDLRLGIYAPSGDYNARSLANVGKNYWTFEPSVSASWFSSKIGLEISGFAGLDFSTKNGATDYQSGNVFHLDGTVAEHLPLGKLGIVGIGASAFYYQQITGDSGSGALLGEFEGRTVGVGPVVSFVTKVGNKTLAAEVKWLPELDVQNRLKGDMVWFKLGLCF